MDMPPTFIQQIVNVEKPLMGRPNCPYPKSGSLEPDTSKMYDGWITLENHTDKVLEIKMCFTLPDGYHLEILDESNRVIFSKRMLIKSAHKIVETESGFESIILSSDG